MPRSRNKHFTALRAHALAYPEATEEFPWGESVIKVRGRVFVFFGSEGGGVSLSAKLPFGAGIALMLPFAEPTGYNLGRSGWVSASFEAGDEVPVKMLRGWIDESYRAVAPKRLLKLLDGEVGEQVRVRRGRPGASARKSAAKPRVRKAGSRSRRGRR